MLKNFLVKVELFFSKVVDWVPSVLNTQIGTIDKSPVTIGTLAGGLIALFVGYYLIRKSSYQIENKVLTRFGIEPAVRHTMRTFIFYFMLLLLILFVLQLLNIPITVFTVVGGALAVGIGLGSQNIVYDFLSGLIIILEHPIRKGDVVELENVRGKVEHIGARATRVYTVDHKHLVIPNNFFLSKIVLNWTLSNEVIRADVSVGVAYGSPTKKVVELIHQAIGEHKKIKKKPEPIILFADFGSNALIFKLHFWAAISSLMDMKKIQSDLRFRIAELFAENNIVIAFPQRDLHFRSPEQPLRVELIPQSSQTESPNR